MRVLILEDDHNRHKAFRRNLIGCDVQIVETAPAAIEYLNSVSWDVLFLDHDLGGEVYQESGDGTGYEVACWLEEHVDKQPKRIIIHSFNAAGAEKMLAALPSAICGPGVWANPDLIGLIRGVFDK